MPVPYTFGTATSAIPLSQLDDNFAAPITIGNTAVQLGNTVTTLNNMTLANVTISSGTITITNVSVTTANVSGTANVSTLVVVGNATVGGNTTITGNITAANANVTSSLVLSGGTANGVAYLNTSKQVTTGTALVFDGSNLGLGVAPSAWALSGVAALQVKNAGYWGYLNRAYMSANMFIDSNGSTYYIASDFATYYVQLNGGHNWLTAPSGTANAAVTSFIQTMTLDASGNLGIGTTSPASTLDVVASGVATGTIRTSSTTGAREAKLRLNVPSTGGDDPAGQIEFTFGTGYTVAGSIQMTHTNPNMKFFSGTTERARITSSGYFKASNTGTYQSSSSTYHELCNDANANTVRITNTIASGYTDAIIQAGFTGYSPNTTNSWFLFCDDPTTNRVQLRSNGGIANYSANDVNLSDRREKTNFAPAKSYLDVICAIPVQTFNYIDQNLEEDPGLTLGVVAQDVQAVAPELVSESNWASKDEEPKMRLSIYQTDLQYALMKCIQEQQALITQLTARITALEGA